MVTPPGLCFQCPYALAIPEDRPDDMAALLSVDFKRSGAVDDPCRSSDRPRLVHLWPLPVEPDPLAPHHPLGNPLGPVLLPSVPTRGRILGKVI
jgi:hypothetical protein